MRTDLCFRRAVGRLGHGAVCGVSRPRCQHTALLNSELTDARVSNSDRSSDRRGAGAGELADVCSNNRRSTRSIDPLFEVREFECFALALDKLYDLATHEID